MGRLLMVLVVLSAEVFVSGLGGLAGAAVFGAASSFAVGVSGAAGAVFFGGILALMQEDS